MASPTKEPHMRNGHRKISKAEFYNMGSFANSKLFRKADKRGVWSYYHAE